MEADFIKYWAMLAAGELLFEDDQIFPGTATIDGFPIDISIKGSTLTLNCVGVWSGTARTMSKGK